MVEGAQAPETKHSEEEASVKRNTDCVYFLASPLTCKKGIECEYRHSEYARVNPRDCYFWLNGNCLNPKCGFRHPPLDGIRGTQATPSTRSLHYPAKPPVPPPSGKQAIPCIFFQKGSCRKGNWCPFSHEPSLGANNKSQPDSSTVSSAPQVPKVNLAAPADHTGSWHRDAPAPNSETSDHRKSVPAAVIAADRNIPPPDAGDRIPPRKVSDPPPFNGCKGVADREVNLGFPNGIDSGDCLREPSPGFDVLVGNGSRDSGHYHGECLRQSSAGIEGSNFDSLNDYDDASYVPGIDSDVYLGCPERIRRLSAERMFPQDGLEHLSGSDLRYMLSKKRMAASDIGLAERDEFLPENLISHNFPGPAWGHFCQVSSPRLSSRDRLRSRLKWPETFKSNGGGNLRSRVRLRGSSASFRTPHQRPSLVAEDKFCHEPRGQNPRVRRRHVNNGSHFAGPKSLAELREERVAGKRNRSVDLPFEGPLPLGEILKRKRSGGAVAAGMAAPVDNDHSATFSGEDDTEFRHVEYDYDVAGCDKSGTGFVKKIGIMTS